MMSEIIETQQDLPDENTLNVKNISQIGIQ